MQSDREPAGDWIPASNGRHLGRAANQSTASSNGAGLLSMYDEVIAVVGEGGRVVGGASRGVGKG